MVFKYRKDINFGVTDLKTLSKKGRIFYSEYFMYLEVCQII